MVGGEERTSETAARGEGEPNAELWDLENLARARRLCDWMFAQFASSASGSCAEIGPGIGTFSARLLDRGVDRLLLVEPEAVCARMLEERFAGDPRVSVRREGLPEAQSLLTEQTGFDFILCQNVLEHVEEDGRAVEVMAAALRPEGRLAVLVPANPALFGPLDREYGHCRRYSPARLRNVVERAGLRVTALYPFNALGIVGWWLKKRTRATSLGRSSLATFDALLPLWRPLEERMRPPWGLSLIVHATRPS